MRAMPIVVVIERPVNRDALALDIHVEISGLDIVERTVSPGEVAAAVADAVETALRGRLG